MPQNLTDLVAIFIKIIVLLLPVVFALAVLIFFWGLAKFIGKSGDSASHEEGKQLIKWGLISIFVMLSLFGILRYAYEDIGFSRPFGLPLLPDSQSN